MLDSVESLYCHVLESKELMSSVVVILAGSLLWCMGIKSLTSSDLSDQTLLKFDHEILKKHFVEILASFKF